MAGADTTHKSQSRSSFGTFLDSSDDPVLQQVEIKIAQWSQIPVEHGESFYLLRYEVGQNTLNVYITYEFVKVE